MAFNKYMYSISSPFLFMIDAMEVSFYYETFTTDNTMKIAFSNKICAYYY